MNSATIDVPVTNRIAKYFDEPVREDEQITNNGGISNNTPEVGTKPGGNTCETCKYQGLGWCRRFPARVYVMVGKEYFEACGEYDNGSEFKF